MNSSMSGVSIWVRVKASLSSVRVTSRSCQISFSSWRRWTGKASMSSLLRMIPWISEISVCELWSEEIAW